MPHWFTSSTRLGTTRKERPTWRRRARRRGEVEARMKERLGDLVTMDDDFVKSRQGRRHSKKIQMQGARILRNEAYIEVRRRWTFYEAVMDDDAVRLFSQQNRDG
jgi:hypothetical protein